MSAVSFGLICEKDLKTIKIAFKNTNFSKMKTFESSKGRSFTVCGLSYTYFMIKLSNLPHKNYSLPPEITPLSSPD